MKVLLDSGVWWRKSGKLPMKKPLADFLEHDVTEWWVSPFAMSEMIYKVKHKKLPAPQGEKTLTGRYLDVLVTRASPNSLAGQSISSNVEL